MSGTPSSQSQLTKERSPSGRETNASNEDAPGQTPPPSPLSRVLLTSQANEITHPTTRMNGFLSPRPHAHGEVR